MILRVQFGFNTIPLISDLSLALLYWYVEAWEIWWNPIICHTWV